ncbi:MAG: hypothetical protein NZ577_02570 [Vicinamibacterales bacterium]|nr:hypothetical protein [Vicinamibacterales bacterium]
MSAGRIDHVTTKRPQRDVLQDALDVAQRREHTTNVCISPGLKDVAALSVS